MTFCMMSPLYSLLFLNKNRPVMLVLLQPLTHMQMSTHTLSHTHTRTHAHTHTHTPTPTKVDNWWVCLDLWQQWQCFNLGCQRTIGQFINQSLQCSNQDRTSGWISQPLWEISLKTDKQARTDRQRDRKRDRGTEGQRECRQARDSINNCY